MLIERHDPPSYTILKSICYNSRKERKIKERCRLPAFCLEILSSIDWKTIREEQTPTRSQVLQRNILKTSGFLMSCSNPLQSHTETSLISPLILYDKISDRTLCFRGSPSGNALCFFIHSDIANSTHPLETFLLFLCLPFGLILIISSPPSVATTSSGTAGNVAGPVFTRKVIDGSPPAGPKLLPTP